MRDDLDDAANEENAMRRVGIAKGQLSVPADFDTMGAAEIQAMFEGDTDLVHAVLSAHIVTYCDQWNNRHTLEARAFGVAQNQRSVFVRFLEGPDQMGPPEQPWMSIDDLGSITLTGNAYPSKDRIIPARHAAQIKAVVALAPRTALEQPSQAAEDE